MWARREASRVAFASANGHAVSELRLTLPRVGVWHASLLLEDAQELQGPVQLQLGELSFSGTARRASRDSERGVARLVGGGGGFPREATPKHYRNAPLSLPLQDLLQVAGEVLSPRSSQDELNRLLAHWVVEKTACGRALAALAERFGLVWRVQEDGKVWVGQEAWPEVELQEEPLEEEPLERRVVFGEPVQGLSPGVSVGGRRIASVEHRLTAAEARTTALYFEGEA
jgi:hypothetical protein